MNFDLKPGMLLGAASAPIHSAGGSQQNTWYDWYRQGHIADGTDPSALPGRWEEDLELMSGLGLQCFRLGVEWSRVEPEDGVFDEAAIACYRRALQALADRGIRPLLTLHHFSCPLWLEERGGFAEGGSVTCFLRFVHRIVESLGDLAGDYITINEPNLYAYRAFLEGSWPPGRRNLMDMARVMTNLAAAHIEAYGLIRKTRLGMGFTDTRVSFANHLRFFAPLDPADPVHRFWASRSRQLFQGSLTRAMCTGRVSFPIGGHPSIIPGQYCDFHAISYHGRTTVSGPARGSLSGLPADDLGREICPQGIVEVCREVCRLLPRPIYIVANGVCDGADAFRARYIAEHLQALCASDLPVEQYYYWSLLDGWEWDRGRSARFGLVRVDRDTGARALKPSGEFYRQVIAQGGVSEELYRRFCDAPYPTC